MLLVLYIAHENVLKFNISMDNALSVHEVHGQQQLFNEQLCLGLSESFFLD